MKSLFRRIGDVGKMGKFFTTAYRTSNSHLLGGIGHGDNAGDLEWAIAQEGNHFRGNQYG